MQKKFWRSFNWHLSFRIILKSIVRNVSCISIWLRLDRVKFIYCSQKSFLKNAFFKMRKHLCAQCVQSCHVSSTSLLYDCMCVHVEGRRSEEKKWLHQHEHPRAVIARLSGATSLTESCTPVSVENKPHPLPQEAPKRLSVDLWVICWRNRWKCLCNSRYFMQSCHSHISRQKKQCIVCQTNYVYARRNLISVPRRRWLWYPFCNIFKTNPDRGWIPTAINKKYYSLWTSASRWICTSLFTWDNGGESYLLY